MARHSRELRENVVKLPQCQTQVAPVPREQLPGMSLVRDGLLAEQFFQKFLQKFRRSPRFQKRRQHSGAMRCDEQSTPAATAMAKMPPVPTAHLLRAVQENEIAPAQLGEELAFEARRKAPVVCVETERFGREAQRGEPRLKVFEQGGLARAIRPDNGSAVTHLRQLREQFIPSQAAQPVADAQHAVGGERIVARFHRQSALPNLKSDICNLKFTLGRATRLLCPPAP